MKTKYKIRVTTFCFLLLTFNCIAQVETPAPKHSKTVLLMGGIAHIGNGTVIENSVIAFKDGKLTMVADARVVKLDGSAFDTTISISGKHVYPGIIAPNSTLGLVEIDAVRATEDMNEAGNYTPHVRSIIAYNAESKITTTVRSNGVLMGQITPRGNVVSGTSSIVQFDAWNWEDAAYKLDDGIHINWHNMFNRWTGKADEKYTERINELKDFFTDALAYSKVKNHLEKNLRFESMRGLFNGTQTLFIHTNYVKEITDAVYFAKENNISKMVIVGGYDAWMVADMLKDNKVAVILRRVHELPVSEDDDIYLPYKLPKKLVDAGVLVCLENSGDMEAMGTRNLPFYAGTATAYGLSKEEALMLITLNTAKILGIDATTGSLEPGKDATFFISTGDALDVKTNNVEQAYIQGRFIDLDNHQKKLYRKYSDKYETN
ncbi:MAG: amidohydrolase family protein [Flavobacteriales bacterium]|nr:amidohydrolase family protein [Flavobacteriales bacterium]MCB9174462.1 amidohydrolase family protein [Flavobacteriales bacterium]